MYPPLGYYKYTKPLLELNTFGNMCLNPLQALPLYLAASFQTHSMGKTHRSKTAVSVPAKTAYILDILTIAISDECRVN